MHMPISTVKVNAITGGQTYRPLYIGEDGLPVDVSVKTVFEKVVWVEGGDLLMGDDQWDALEAKLLRAVDNVL